MATYLETLGKLQQQALDTLKQVQTTQLAALNTIGEMVAEVPAFKPASMIESLPTVGEVTEMNTQFARNVLEQQSAFATQLVGIFTQTQKSAVVAAEQVVRSAQTTVKTAVDTATASAK